MTRKIKVLHFTSSSGVFGAEQIIFLLASKCNTEKIQSMVCALTETRLNNTGIVEHAADIGIPVVNLEGKRKFDFSVVMRLRELIKAENIDILHTHNYKSDILGIAAARLSRIPVIATAHGFTTESKAVRFYEKMDRILLSHFFDRTVAVSPTVLPGVKSSKLRIISNGIDVRKFSITVNRQKARGKLGFSDDNIVIGTVGRLSIEKNQELLLRVFADVVKIRPDARLLIIGDGPERVRLEQLASTLDISRFTAFPGIVNDIEYAYRTMDIFVLPSDTEGIPLTILESMASNVPVIATKVGGVPTIIKNEHTGILVEKGNRAGLYNSVLDLVENPAKCLSMAKAAYEHVEKNFSVMSMCRSYEELYKEVLK